MYGQQYFKVTDNGIAECVVIIRGEDEESYRIGKIAAFQIQSLIVAYKERFDRDNFIKNLLLDNLLLVDIYSRAKKLRIEKNARRIVYLIEMETGKDVSSVEIVRNLFPAKNKDFITAVDEKSIILVKELKEKEDSEEVERHAAIIRDMLTVEVMNKVYVAVGTVVTDLKNVSSSYKEARMALEVGRIFEPEKTVICYEKLGIGRLIYQLPVTLCRMFMNEVFRSMSVDKLDEETLATVAKFFDCDLNVTEAARQLYIHRNTLVYRLDRLQKLTGLDVRVFGDAITFKITMMVNKYMNCKEQGII
jgi:carbohydrate diacid regulator